MHEGSREYAFLAVSPSENSAAIEGVLAFGILWLDWTRSRVEKRPIEGLRVFVPEGTSRFLRERALALAPSARSKSSNSTDPKAAFAEWIRATPAISKAV